MHDLVDALGASGCPAPAYVDTSCLVAIAFAEPGHKTLASRLDRFDHLFASNVLEAELRAAFRIFASRF